VDEIIEPKDTRCKIIEALAITGQGGETARRRQVPRIAADLKHPGGVCREKVVSRRESGELLGVSKLEFVRILDRHGVPTSHRPGGGQGRS